LYIIETRTREMHGYGIITARHKPFLVAGVEVASAKTQTSKVEDVRPHSSGFSAQPSQFVVGMFIVTSVCSAFHSILYRMEMVYERC